MQLAGQVPKLVYKINKFLSMSTMMLLPNYVDILLASQLDKYNTFWPIFYNSRSKLIHSPKLFGAPLVDSNVEYKFFVFLVQLARLAEQRKNNFHFSIFILFFIFIFRLSGGGRITANSIPQNQEHVLYVKRSLKPWYYSVKIIA